MPADRQRTRPLTHQGTEDTYNRRAMTQSFLRSRLLRTASTLALGELALHELRYVLAYGGDASKVLAEQGHGYLVDVGPTLVVFALALIIARLFAAAAGSIGARGPRRALAAGWAGFAAGLLATYSAQELAEGFFATGHPGGFAGVLGDGGWLAMPLAAVIGVVAALLSRALEETEVFLATRMRRRRALPRATNQALPTAVPRVALELDGLAFGLARRPPPQTAPV
jgi:hypothetical protein